MPQTGPGLIGKELPLVQEKSDFFGFFNFAAVGKIDLPNRQTNISFKPTGDAFHDLVTLEVVIDADKIIQMHRLIVARSFIDDPKQCVYAADLVKSYVTLEGTNSHDALDSLAQEISVRSFVRSTATVIMRQPLPPMPNSPSEAYQTYLGQRPSQTLHSGSTSLMLKNETLEKVPVLVLSTIS
jgi:hypothetical protein